MTTPSKSGRPLRAAEQLRDVKRLDLRASDGLKMRILVGPNQSIDARLFNISPTGAGVLIDRSLASEFVKEKVFDLTLATPDQQDFPARGTVKWTSDFKESDLKVGLEFIRSEFDPSAWAGVPSIAVPESSPLVGAIYKPYLFYERAALKIVRLAEHRWQIKIFDSELLSLTGIQYEIHLNSMAQSDSPIIVRVESLIESHEDWTLVEVKPMQVPSEVAEWIAQQLILHADINPQTVRSVGFNFKRLSNGLRFRYIKTQEDYLKVLKLRLLAYGMAGKVAPGKTIQDMVAPLDSISRIIAVYHGKKIVGSVAVAFPPDEETVLDTERAFANGYPKKVPAKRDMVEVARLCTDPDYRQSDLMLRILEHIYKVLRCGNRKVVITSTDEKLWPLYKSLGFRKTGMSYAHPYLDGLRHHVITQAAPQADSGSRINPFAWNYAWRDMSHHLEASGTIQRGTFARSKVRFYEWMGRVLKINRKRKY